MLVSKYRRLAGTVAVGVALASAAAPIAAADDWWAQTGATGTTAVRPDDRPGARGPGTAVDTRPVVVVEQPSGFDWTDAGIGAGATLGVILLASGLSLVARRHRKASAPAV